MYEQRLLELVSMSKQQNICRNVLQLFCSVHQFPHLTEALELRGLGAPEKEEEAT